MLLSTCLIVAVEWWHSWTFDQFGQSCYFRDLIDRPTIILGLGLSGLIFRVSHCTLSPKFAGVFFNFFLFLIFSYQNACWGCETQKIEPDPNFCYDRQKFRRQCVNVIDSTWGRIYFLMCEKFWTQCAMTLRGTWRRMKRGLRRELMKERGTGHQFLLSKVANAYKVGFKFSVVLLHICLQ